MDEAGTGTVRKPAFGDSDADTKGKARIITPPVLVPNSKPLNEAGWVEIDGVWFYNGHYYGRKDPSGAVVPTRTEQRLVGRAKLHETTKEYSKGQYAAVVLAELDTIRMMMLNADDAKTVRKLGHEALERIYAFLK